METQEKGMARCSRAGKEEMKSEKGEDGFQKQCYGIQEP